jgi:DNA-binding CsgD family transcriptional regulator
LANSPLARLTPRELDVLREMAQGKSNPGIAKALFLSESTVEEHVNSIFVTLGLTAEPEFNRRVAAVLTFLRDPEPGFTDSLNRSICGRRTSYGCAPARPSPRAATRTGSR